MQYPQVLVYETDGLLAAMLRETSKAKRWALRELRKRESCLRLLRSLGPSVLVLKIATNTGERSVSTGRLTSATSPDNAPKEGEPQTSAKRTPNPPDREKQHVDSLELLADVYEKFPDTAAIVVGDVEDLPLTNLAWDLGASYVLMPPLSRQILPEIVVNLMQETIEKLKGGQ
jgi:hypothetical protein